MPKPKPEAINRAIALAEQLAYRSPATGSATAAYQAAAAAAAAAAAKTQPPTASSSAVAAAAAMSTTQQRPPITCHVLDTTAGRPAAGIPVTLTLLAPYGPSTPLAATTNADGRVTGWASPAGEPATTLEELFHNVKEHSADAAADAEMAWALRFDTRAYWEAKGVRAFFPEVEIKFVVRGRDEHYHVPLLLGPFNYTTYRGS